MDETLFQLVRGAGFALAVAFAVGLQRFFRHATSPGSLRINLPLWALNGAVIGLACGACVCTVARWGEREGFGLLHLAQIPGWLAIPATVLALDLLSYLWHRANHRLALLWRFHRVHHSDSSFTVSTGVRFHPGELLLSVPIRLAAVAALGAPVEGVVLFELVFNVMNLFEHGNVDLPARLETRLARLFVTPALHRRHHSRKRTELDTNFGTIFTFWDRRLGTYGESSSRTQYAIGLPAGFVPSGVGAALLLPLRTERG